ncbi:MAG: CRISPR-associated endonuclease Cas1 [candidate division WOR-3 bacterium]
MSALYLTEQGAKILRTSSRLIIKKEDKTLLQVPIIKISRLLIFGRVSISIPVFELLLKEGIPTAFLSIDGRLKGVLEPVKSKNILLRLRQYERARDEQFRVKIAQSIVLGKIRNQKRLLQRFSHNHPELDFNNELKEIEGILKRVEAKRTLAGILGLEGQATAVYFRGYSKLFKTALGFEERTRRPPRNQVNSLLSLGYTLLTNEYFSLTAALGFDPYLGFYHGIGYGRPSLALDLVEELRNPVIDNLVLELISKRMLKAEDFIGDDYEGFFLTSQGKKVFFIQYERRMNREFLHPKNKKPTNIRKVMREQVYSLMKAIEENKPYEPFFIG